MPLATNDSPVHKQINRRVEIARIILTQDKNAKNQLRGAKFFLLKAVRKPAWYLCTAPQAPG